MDLLIALTAGASGATLVIAILRLLGPIGVRFAGVVLKTKAELEADRDRIIDGLRGEVNDLARRLEAAEERANQAERDAVEAHRKAIQLEGFIDRFLARYGLDRRDIERGEPWPARVDK